MPSMLGTKSTDVPRWPTTIWILNHTSSPEDLQSPSGHFLNLSTRTPVNFYPKLSSEALCVRGSPVINFLPGEDAALSRIAKKIKQREALDIYFEL